MDAESRAPYEVGMTPEAQYFRRQQVALWTSQGSFGILSFSP